MSSFLSLHGTLRFAARIDLRWPWVRWDETWCLNVAVDATLATGRGSNDAARGQHARGAGLGPHMASGLCALG